MAATNPFLGGTGKLLRHSESAVEAAAVLEKKKVFRKIWLLGKKTSTFAHPKNGLEAIYKYVTAHSHQAEIL